MSTVAIIGSGISGLGAAYLLNPVHSITLYEREKRIGGHTRTLIVDYDGRRIPVDTGFIVYNERNYPHLSAMFRHLSVDVQKSNMTFGVTVNNGEVEWGAQNPNSVFGQRSHFFKPAFYRMLLDIAKFNKGAVAYIAKHPASTLGAMVDSMGLGDWFRRYYLLPMGGAIWSCSVAQMLQFPAHTFVQFFDNHGLLTVTQQPQWYTVKGGSQEYVNKLIPSFSQHIRTDCGAVSIRREDGKVLVSDTQGQTRSYDHVVLACHANETLALLEDASEPERKALSAFTYQKNHAVLHRDVSFMPRRRRCWSSWIYNLEQGRQETQALGVTYWMNLLQSIDNAAPLFVTLNPTHPVARDAIFDEHTFEHPVFTEAAIAAQSELTSLQGVRNTWFCGAHMRYGFHEDGLQSAVKVARQLGAEAPWH